MPLREKLAALVDSVLSKKVTASKKTAEGPSDLDQQMEQQGEVVDLERKPDDFDDKREKYEDKIKDGLHEVIDRGEETKSGSVWKTASAEEVPDGLVSITVKTGDGHSEKIIVNEEKLDDIMMRSSINGWVITEVRANHDAPEWFKVAEDASAQAGGEGDSAFNYIVSLMSNDTGMTIDKAIDETKKVFYKTDGTPSDVMSQMEGEMTAAAVTSMISEMEHFGAKFNPGPDRYIKRLYSLFKRGVFDLRGVEVRDADFEETAEE